MKLLKKTIINEASKSMGYWREKVTQNIFILLSILSVFVFIPSINLSIQNNQIDMALFSTFIYFTLLFLTINKSINYKVKGSIVVICTFSFGIYLIYKLGPSSTGNIWFITCAVYASILFGTKIAILSSIMIFLVYFLPIPLLDKSSFNWSFQYKNITRVWLIHGLSTLLIATSISVSISMFLNGFSRTLNKVFSTKKATILGLAKLAEHKDTDTGKHILRLQEYAGIITEYLFSYHNNDGYITKDYIEDIKVSSVLHDIGKVGIKDNILRKPGKLTPEEFEEMKKHTILGGEVISEIEKNITGRSVYSIGKEIAFYHHEKWNGTGYPFGLKGEKIPLSARIIAIVDVYDALTTKRPYKEPFSHEVALSIITKESGKHFDPLMVEALIMNETCFRDIALQTT